MTGEWRKTTLGEEVDLLTGFPFKSDRYTDAADGIRLVRGDNIVQGAMRWDGVKKWPLSEQSEYEMYELREDDVVLAMDRPWIEAGLKYAAISKHELPCLLVQRTARMRGGKRLNTRFLRYLIGSREFTQHIHAITTGTAVPHISARQIKEFAFNLPPISQQKRIAHILSTLDDKIELNRRMNATLEAMARALFQSWFVDFDPVRRNAEGGESRPEDSLFPGSFEDSALGEIPKGWRTGKLGEVAKNPKRGVSTNQFEDDAAYIGLEHMPRKSIALSEWGSAEKLESNKSQFKRGEILFGKLRPYFHKVGVAPVEGVCSTDILVITPSQSIWFGFVLGHVSSVALIDHTNALSTGTKMPRTKWQDIAEFEVVFPPLEVASTFTLMIEPVVQRILANTNQSRTLAALRDTLLPRLLSGTLPL